MITLISAMGRDSSIGYKNELLWDIPTDMAHFKNYTDGKIVVVGRKTFESTGYLRGRYMVILTSDINYIAPDNKNIVVINNYKDVLKGYNYLKSLFSSELVKDISEEVVIAGGAIVYGLFIDYADKLSLTFVDDEPKNADSFFPIFNLDDFNIESSVSVSENGYNYNTNTYVKSCNCDDYESVREY